MINHKWFGRFIITWSNNYETGGLTINWGFFKKDMETEIVGSEFELTFKSTIGIIYRTFAVLFFLLVIILEIVK